MTQVTVLDQDVRATEEFLKRLIGERFPDVDVEDGSAFRDILIKAHAYIVAYVRQEIQTVRLTRNPKFFGLLDDVSRDEAITDYLSRFFLAPGGGTYARGVITLHFRTNDPVTLYGQTRFYKTQSLIYRIDGDGTDVILDANSLTPYVALTGEIVDYRVRVPVVAELPGAVYTIDPGLFSAATRMPSTFIYAENEDRFSTADDGETPTELLARANDALSTRDLNSTPAIKNTMRTLYRNITDIEVVGYGEPEMIRDMYAPDNVNIGVHLGGDVDIYVMTKIQKERTYRATLGAAFTDPRGLIVAFTDPEISDWRVLVRAGQVIRLYNSQANESDRYVIQDVSRTRLYVSKFQPFPKILPAQDRGGEIFEDAAISGGSFLASPTALFTDSDVSKYVVVSGSDVGNDGTYRIVAVSSGVAELDSVALVDEDYTTGLLILVNEDVVDYSIGDNSEADNILSRRRTGVFTNTLQRDGCVLLPAHPIYLIREASTYLPADSDADAVTGRVNFYVQTNAEPQNSTASPLEFRVFDAEPLYANSDQQLRWLEVGPAPEMQGRRGQLLTGSQTFVANDATRAFGADDIGKYMEITKAARVNNRGIYVITTIVNTTSVTLSKVGDGSWTGTSEPFAHWALSDKQRFDGGELRVVYDTVEDFAGMSSVVTAPSRRIQCADLLVRGFYAVYVGFVVRYVLRPGASTDLDDMTARRIMIDYIERYPSTQTMSVSDIVHAVQSAYPQVQVQLPIQISYTLLAPDGRAVPYVTNDFVELSRSKLAQSAPEDRLEAPAAVGVSSRVVMYTSDVSLIQFIKV